MEIECYAHNKKSGKWLCGAIPTLLSNLIPSWNWDGFTFEVNTNSFFYEHPIVDVINIEVEKGFASSPNEGVGEEGGEGEFVYEL